MKDIPISLKQISSLSLGLALSILLIFIHSVDQSSWSTLIYDHHTGIEVEEVNLLKEFPLTDSTLEAYFTGTYRDFHPIKVYNDGKLGLFDDKEERFDRQMLEAIGGEWPSDNMKSYRFAIEIDLSDRNLSSIVMPHLFFYQLHGEWTAYIDGQEFHKGNHESTYQSLKIPSKSSGKILFVIESSNSESGKNKSSSDDLFH